jgi:gamma-polyglutamate biosynthesis protein CapA
MKNTMSDAVKLVAVGDIMLGDHPVRFGHGVKSMIEKNGGMSPFVEVGSILVGNDIVFGNVEAVLSDKGLVKGNLVSEEFRGRPDYAPMLASAGFNVVSFSNNHCMEHGIEAFWDTVQCLRRQSLQVAGLSTPSGEYEPVDMSIRGCTVRLLSYSLCPENYHKGPTVPYAHQQDFDKVLSGVKSLRGQADLLIVSLHWGYEYMEYPSPKQVQLAHRLVDEAGVNLIIGHHPHVLQAVERYRNAVVVYSLGNFVFDMWQKPTRYSMVFRAELSRSGDISYNLSPLWINKKRQPEPLLGEDQNKKFMRRIVRLEELLNERCLSHDLSNQMLVNRLEEGYAKVGEKMEIAHRISSYIYFLLNIYRYSPNILLQSFLRFFMRRLEAVVDTTRA